MGAHQDQHSFLRVSQRVWYLILVVLCLLPASLLITSFIYTALPSRHSSYIHEITALIDEHKAHLEMRDADHKRSIGDLFSGIGSALGIGGTASNDTPGGSGGILSSIGNAITGGLTGDLAMPAMSLGVGLANGTVTGLNMTVPSKMVAMMKEATGVSLLAQNLGSGLTSTLLGSINISSLIATDPNAPGGTLGGATGTVGLSVLALAQGLGGGSASGLGLTQSKVGANANSTFFNNTGVPGIAGNFGQGLTNTFLSSINISSLTSSLFTSMMATTTNSTDGMLGGANGMVGQAVLALAQGLGGGASQGLNLTTVKSTAYNTSGVSGIAGNFGQGLTMSALQNINIASITNSLTSAISKRANLHRRGLNTSSFNIAAIASGAAIGLGQGAAIGLGLQNDSNPVPNSSQDPAAISQDFTKGLTSSFLANGTGSKLVSSITSLASTTTNATSAISSLNFAAIAQGAGTGLGQGAAIGLGFQEDTAPVTNTSSQDAQSVSQDFTKGLVASFLGNGTTTKLINSFRTVNTSFLANVNALKLAEGFAVGLVSGAGSQITSLMVVNGNTSSFDDSVGGAANGFGFGLGSSGAMLVKQVLGQSSGAMPGAMPAVASSGDLTSTTSLDASAAASTSVSKSATSSSDASAATISTDAMPASGSMPAMKRRTVVSVLSKRQSTADLANQTVTNITNIAQVLSNLNASMINPLLQTGINDLTCTGVGGFAGIGLGLIFSKTIDINSLTKLASSGTSNITLPDQNFAFSSSGNTYALNPAKGINSVTVNGMGVIKLAVLLVLHIIIAISTYFTLIPLVMIYRSSQEINYISRRQTAPCPISPRWVTWSLYSALPSSVLVFAFGIAGSGTASFASTHAILGLLLFLLTLGASATTFLNSRAPPPYAPTNTLTPIRIVHRSTIALLLLFAFLTFLTGWIDVTNLAVCAVQQVLQPAAWLFLGVLLLGPMLLAVGMEGLKFMVLRGREEGVMMTGGDGGEARGIVIEQPQLVPDGLSEKENAYMDSDKRIDFNTGNKI